MPAYLDAIVAAHRADRARDGRNVGELRTTALAHRTQRRPADRRDFVASLLQGHRDLGMAVISEIKRRSPSKGDLDPDLDVAATAADYQAGGARAISVLTDVEFFGGSVEDLVLARASCELPCLRKDFTIDAVDLYDAVLMNADAVLLIAAVLEDNELATLLALADELGLAALVEVHDETELIRALHAGSRLVGVNQRDLRTFEVDRERALALGRSMPDDVVAVAESGIRDAEDVRQLAEAGYRAVLVGETLVRAGDRTAALGDLLSRVTGVAGATSQNGHHGNAGSPVGSEGSAL